MFGGASDANTGMVTFKVNTQQVGTRAATGKGALADSLYYGVYEYVNNQWALVPTISKTTPNSAQPISLDGTVVNIRLAKQKQYSVIFWAQSDSTMFTVDWANHKIDVKSPIYANAEGYDAFWACDTVTLTGALSREINLVRPFAQLNIGISNDDLQAALDASVEVVSSAVTVKGVPTSMDLMGGTVANVTVDDPEAVVSYSLNAIPANDAWTFPVSGYQYLALNYVLVGREKSLATVELAYKDSEGLDYTNKFTDVPVRRNYRTNVYGDLLTNEAEYEIDINAAWSGTEANIEIVEVATAADIQEAINNMQEGDSLTIVLTDNIDLNDLFGGSNAPATRAAGDDPSFTVAAKKVLTIDLNGKMLSATSKQTGKNYNMFDVRGTLTVQNGTMEYKHKGDNMGWNNSTNLFNVTAGGVLNLNGITAKNLGGSDMAFVAHLNNWGEATLNVENSILESTYIAVRVFNSGYDMNNVTIKNSTLKGKYCFWVHNYKGAGDSVGTDETLNLDIYNNENTFECTGKAPILYGFANPIYYDAYGYEFVAEGVGLDAKGSYQIYNAEGLKWVAEQVNTMEHYVNQSANIFDGKVVCLANDIDLSGAEWTPIGDYAFSRTSFNGTFDGKGYTVSNFKVTKPVKWPEKVTEASYGFFGNVKGTIKNLTVKDATINPEGGRYSAALVGRLHDGGSIYNCHVINSSVTINHWQVGGLVGQNNNGNIANSSVVGSTITGKAAVGAIVGMDMVAGEHTIENCRVANTILVQNASFGESYDASYGLAVGLVNASGIILHLNNVVVENNTIKAVAANTLVGDAEDGAKIYLDGSMAILTAKDLAAALKAGGNYVLANDIALSEPIQVSDKEFTLNGNGYKIDQSSNYTTEGTAVAALLHPIRCTATIENIVFDGIKGDGPIRSVDTKLTIKNVTVQNCERTVTGATAQGLFRLHGESTVQDCTFKNNICPMAISINWDGNNDLPQSVTDCVFENNTCHSTAVLYYVKGSGCKISGNEFVSNTVTVTGGSNAATVYMGFTENNVITNNLFKNNTVNAGTSKRVSGGLMVGYAATITGNSFVGNTVNGEKAKGNDVCASVYYTDIDLSGNYWGGSAPVEDDDYFVEYPDNNKVIINDYLTTWSR